MALLTEPLVIALLLIVLVLAGWVAYVEMKLKRFMRGKSGTSLESALESIMKDNQALFAHARTMESLLENTREKLSHAARGLSTIRYNALAGDSAGKQSFATAILSERGDGVVLSSMHSRDTTRVYAKPVFNFTSEHELSAEEKQAIDEARARCALR